MQNKRVDTFLSFTFLMFLLLLTTIWASLFWQTQTVDARQVAPQFLFSEGGAERRHDATAMVTRSRMVDVDFSLLGGNGRSLEIPSGPVPTISLNFFDDLTMTALFEYAEPVAFGGYAWLGHLEDVAYSEVVFVVQNGVFVGNIRYPGGNYQVRPEANGRYAIRQINEAAFPELVNDATPVAVTEPSHSLATLPDDGSIIDVMILYTQQAMDSVGGQAAMEALINLGIVETNTGYANSGVNQRLRLVHTAQVDYVESGSLGTDRDRLRAMADGYMDEVHTWRNQYGADLVSLWVQNGSGCGIAYIMTTVSAAFESSGFNVTRQDCATGNLSFGHELGHNMGARHDWYVDSTTFSPYSYNHGYSYPLGSWRTVMAYNNNCSPSSCTRLMQWSNPNVTIGGVPTGVAAGTSTSCSTGSSNPPCDADNHLTLNNTALTVANFRQTAVIATLHKSVSATEIEVGDPLTYTLIVSNATPFVATSVLLTDSVPARTMLISTSLSGDAIYSGIAPGHVITWYTNSDVAQNGTLIRTFAVLAESAGTLSNTAYLSTTNTLFAQSSNQVNSVILGVASCGFTDSFESGFLNAFWQTYNTKDGRARVTKDLPNSGSYSAIIDDAVGDGVYSEYGIVLNINLAGTSEVDLDFNWYDLADEYHSTYDGVFIRQDENSSWQKVYNFLDGNIISYQSGHVDLESAASANGIALTRTFQIKFQGYDNYYFIPSNISGSDGYALDDIQVSCTCAGIPTTPTVTANHNNNDMMLMWSDKKDSAEFEVWHSFNPYFAPGDAGTTKLINTLSPNYIGSSAADNGINDYYIVRAANGCGTLSLASEVVGEFQFEIKAGS